MSLPFLPGNTFDRKVGQNKHHLSHHFDKNNGVQMMVGERKPGIGGVPLAGQDLRPRNSVYPKGEGSDKPAWVAFDKQVLCFDAYFQESVIERAAEQYRVRYVRVYFYLEDDTIQVIEPRSKNAGYNQGIIINRHRIPRPKPYDDTFYSVEDFNIQKELEFYGKRFKLTDCDPFTRNFLTKIGVRVADPVEAPKDPYRGLRENQDGAQNPLRPYERADSLKQFLDYDRHVLRFNAVWDDRDTKFGEVRRFKLHYFLADDTIEILEVFAPNCGRDSCPTFLSRQKLPKDILNMGKPGDKPTRTVLNVIGHFFDGGRYILDNLKTGSIQVNYFRDEDLMVGRTVNVFGRKLLLTDADEFTRNFYKNKYGINNFDSVHYDDGNNARHVQRMNPPFNGFGSEEDSLASCQKIIPEPPKKDFIKWMAYDKNALESNCLRFLAKIQTNDQIQADRRFIISYFLSDDSIYVFEPTVKNSGITSGKFLERGKVKKPGQPQYSTQLPEYYTFKDIYVGAVLILNNFHFQLFDCDEYCYKFMESNTQMFPRSSPQNVLSHVRSLVKPEDVANLGACLEQADRMQSGVLNFQKFYSAVKDIVGNNLCDQEIITLARQFSTKKSKEYDFQSVGAVAQDHLRKNNFEQFTRLAEVLQSSDYYNHNERSLFINEARCILKGFRIPLPDYLLDMLLQYVKNDKGDIDLNRLLSTLNWRENTIQHPREDKQDSANSSDFVSLDSQNLEINYQDLVKELQ